MSWMEVWALTETGCGLRWRQMGLNAERGFLPEAGPTSADPTAPFTGGRDTLRTVTAPAFPVVNGLTVQPIP